MSARHKEHPTDVVVATLRLLWRYRVELTVAAGAFWLTLLMGLRFGTVTGTVIAASVLVALTVNGWARSRLMGVLWRAHLRRAVANAIVAARKTALPPRVLRVVETPIGESVTIRVRSGDDIAAVESHASKLAASLRVSQVRVSRDPSRPGDASRARVVLVRRDPLDTLVPIEWPNLYAKDVSLWNPIPVSVDEDGETKYVRLPQRHMLMGGEPGSGKSNALSLMIATAALDPNVDLYVLDGKDYEMTDWTPCCKRFVGLNGLDAIDVLKDVQKTMNDRAPELKARGQRHVEAGDGLRLQLVVVDELPYYAGLTMKSGNKTQGTVICDLLTDLVRRGRAPGVIVCAAAQKPSHDVIPTSLRDLFGYRWCFRVNTTESSDMVLGSKAASMGYDGSSIPTTDAMKGVGYLAAEEGRPIRTKAFRLDNDAVRMLAERAHGLRIDRWQQQSFPVPVEDD